MLPFSCEIFPVEGADTEDTEGTGDEGFADPLHVFGAHAAAIAVTAAAGALLASILTRR